MATVFTRIINGEIPGTFVHRDDRCVAFMSVNPLAPGHTLVVPIVEVDHWIDLPNDLAAHLFEVAQRIGKAQQAALKCERVGLIIAGYEVPHAHVHVVPTTHMGQFDFATAATNIDRTDMESNAAAIRSAL
ncbi:HIT family protein [soil metagenome]